MVTRLKLMPDYECYALWNIESLENVSAKTLPISESLKQRIFTWENRYDETLNQDDPSISGFRSQEDELDFEKEGLLIWKQLISELGRDYEIKYFSTLSNSLYSGE